MKKYFYSAVAAISSSAFAIDDGRQLVDPDLRGIGAEGSPIDAIQTFIKGLLGLLGIVMVVMCLWGGWKILTSGSQDEGKEAGKKIIINAAIGIVVIFFAWTGTNFLFDVLQSGGSVSTR